MMRTVLKWLIAVVVIMLVVFWLLGGGIGKIIHNAGSFSFSFSDLLSSTSSLASFKLPFSPSASDIPHVQIDTVSSNTDGAAYPRYPNESGAVPNGAQSPYDGQVVLAQAAAIAQTVNAQYIEVSVAPGSAPVDISGWTLQSALSGALATIPQAASPFVLGRVNTVGPVALVPGGVAIVVTGPSPVGVSFSENVCTGYLGTLQPFVPPLPQRCPSPAAEIPATAASEARLGSSCFDYIATLPPCTFPANAPSTLSSACRNEIQTKLSYNGCVAAHEGDASFSQNSWRLYLAQGKPLWNVQHDVIRLLDRDGRVVSVLNY